MDGRPRKQTAHERRRKGARQRSLVAPGGEGLAVLVGASPWLCPAGSECHLQKLWRRDIWERLAAGAAGTWTGSKGPRRALLLGDMALVTALRFPRVQEGRAAPLPTMATAGPRASRARQASKVP